LVRITDTLAVRFGHGSEAVSALAGYAVAMA